MATTIRQVLTADPYFIIHIAPNLCVSSDGQQCNQYTTLAHAQEEYRQLKSTMSYVPVSTAIWCQTGDDACFTTASAPLPVSSLRSTTTSTTTPMQCATNASAKRDYEAGLLNIKTEQLPSIFNTLAKFSEEDKRVNTILAALQTQYTAMLDRVSKLPDTVELCCTELSTAIPNPDGTCCQLTPDNRPICRCGVVDGSLTFPFINSKTGNVECNPGYGCSFRPHTLHTGTVDAQGVLRCDCVKGSTWTGTSCSVPPVRVDACAFDAGQVKWRFPDGGIVRTDTPEYMYCAACNFVSDCPNDSVCVGNQFYSNNLLSATGNKPVWSSCIPRTFFSFGTITSTNALELVPLYNPSICDRNLSSNVPRKAIGCVNEVSSDPVLPVNHGSNTGSSLVCWNHALNQRSTEFSSVNDGTCRSGQRTNYLKHGRSSNCPSTTDGTVGTINTREIFSYRCIRSIRTIRPPGTYFDLPTESITLHQNAPLFYDWVRIRRPLDLTLEYSSGKRALRNICHNLPVQYLLESGVIRHTMTRPTGYIGTTTYKWYFTPECTPYFSSLVPSPIWATQLWVRGAANYFDSTNNHETLNVNDLVVRGTSQLPAWTAMTGSLGPHFVSTGDFVWLGSMTAGQPTTLITFRTLSRVVHRNYRGPGWIVLVIARASPFTVLTNLLFNTGLDSIDARQIMSSLNTRRLGGVYDSTADLYLSTYSPSGAYLIGAYIPHASEVGVDNLSTNRQDRLV